MSAIPKKGPVSALPSAAGGKDLNAILDGCTPSAFESAEIVVSEIRDFDAKVREFSEAVLKAIGRTDVEVSYKLETGKPTFLHVTVNGVDASANDWCRTAWSTCRGLLSERLGQAIRLVFIAIDAEGKQVFPPS